MCEFITQDNESLYPVVIQLHQRKLTSGSLRLAIQVQYIVRNSVDALNIPKLTISTLRIKEISVFAVIYRFKLKPHQEDIYKTCWNKIADYFIEKRGALGSCLHKGENDLWVVYSRWPDKATRDASWPGDENAPNEELPSEIREAIQNMQAIKKENQDLEQYDEICLEVIEDKLIGK